ncbi:ultra-long-chain fatty acid omega-hydroxylase-like [Glandiceps talaboti]
MVTLLSAVSVIIAVVVLITVANTLFTLFVFFRDLRQRSKCVQQWPGPKTSWLAGSLKDHPPLGEESVRWRHALSAKFTEGYSFWYGPFIPCVVMNNPRLMKLALKSCDHKPRFGGYGLLVPWLGLGLLISNGDRWTRSRKLLTPAFHFEILKPYFKVYNQTTDIFLDKLHKYSKSGESFEAFQLVSLLTLDILLRCAFTWQDNNCQVQGVDHPYVVAVRELAELTQNRLVNPWMMIDRLFFLSKPGRRYKEMCEYVHKTSEDLIQKRRQELKGKSPTESSGRKYMDFLDVLLTARDSDGNGMTDSEIRAECDTFLFEGHDTTASGISWTLYSLAKHPEHQEKCQLEIDQVLQDKNTDDIEWDDLPKLQYLTQCIKESLRMYPPVPGVHRSAEKEINIDGKVIKPGTVVECNVFGMHHNPDVWPEHNVYKPERFSPENVANMDPFQFLPFVAGPRNCIGQNFALNEEKVVVSRILHKYWIEVDPNHSVERIPLLVLKAKHGIKLTIRPRQ